MTDYFTLLTSKYADVLQRRKSDMQSYLKLHQLQHQRNGLHHGWSWLKSRVAEAASQTGILDPIARIDWMVQPSVGAMMQESRAQLACSWAAMPQARLLRIPCPPPTRGPGG